MVTFLKAQTASVVATAVDFLVTVLLVEVVGLWYVAAAVWGTLCGGITHFSMGRKWVFHSDDPNLVRQAIKYLVIWTGSLFLNAAGVYAITHYLGMPYTYSKVATSVIVGVGYNYFFQKKFVFK